MLNSPFIKLGGSKHFIIETWSDILKVAQLPETRWMATSATISVFVSDQRFLDFLDCDDNGRIRCKEIRQAIGWMSTVVKDWELFTRESDTLPLAVLNRQNDSGDAVYLAAVRILKNLGKEDAHAISLEEVMNRTAILAASASNGDGIIPPVSAPDSLTRQFMEVLQSLYGSVKDASGREGVTESHVVRFESESKLLAQWWDKRSSVDPLCLSALPEDESELNHALQNFHALRPELDRYFLLSRSLPYLEDLQKTLLGGTQKNQGSPFNMVMHQPDNSEQDFFSKLPLAIPQRNRVLTLDETVNPLYQESLADLARNVLEPFLSTKPLQRLEYQQWQRVKKAVESFVRWQKNKPDVPLTTIAPALLTRFRETEVVQKVRTLIEHDSHLGEQMRDIDQVEKLLLYRKHLLPICRNFVSFQDLYSPKTKALFEWGVLVLDARLFRLCLPVDDHEIHRKIAKTSGLFVLYVALTSKKGNTAKNVAVAVTSGGAGRICIGKKGIFYTYEGEEFDAEIFDIIRNPTSLKDSFRYPFRRLGEIIENQIEKIIGSSEKGLEDVLSKRAGELTGSLKKIETLPSDKTSVAKDTSSKQRIPSGTDSGARTQSTFREFIVGLSLSFAAIGTSFAFITKTLSEVRFSHIIATLLACILIIIGPTVILTLVKLQRRDIGTFLEASGWAINGRMKLTGALARGLTLSENDVEKVIGDEVNKG